MSAPLPPASGLRPDLRGVEVDLDDATCPAVEPGESAAFRIEKVQPAGEDDSDLVLLVGDWLGADGDEVGVHVLAHASALPSPGPVQQRGRTPGREG